VITPVRDEEKYIESTIHSVVSQTVPPAEWIIVDDGSTDSTAAIIQRYANLYPWIRVFHRKNRGFRKSGGGVIEAFYRGYNAIRCLDWDFIIKLDGDLSFEAEYFEKVFQYFEKNPRLGIGGGVIYHLEGEQKRLETCPKFHVRGATKFYRRACWEAIGGLWPAPGWDTIDEVKANMLGWTTMSFADLHLLHHRFTGSADGCWTGMVKNGRADYISGYHPLFMLAKCITRLARRPVIIGSLASLYGFATGYLKRIPQVDDRELIRYLRHEQLARLLGKETIWR
jgi:glycosyltransferase involved in cell wall biosynthesis